MKDIKRFFGFHGAEHKTINAFEAGKVLTVENVQSFTTKHPRCGTSACVAWSRSRSDPGPRRSSPRSVGPGGRECRGRAPQGRRAAPRRRRPRAASLAQNRGSRDGCTGRPQHGEAPRTRREERELVDGDVVSACQQACPASAIVFGNRNDRESRVAALEQLRARQTPGGKDALNAMLAAPDLVILDVRTGKDWSSSEFKIKSAVRAPASEYADWSASYSKDKTLVLYCA